MLAALLAAGPAAGDEAAFAQNLAGKTTLEIRGGFPFPDTLPMKIANSAGAVSSGTQKYRFRSSFFGAVIIGHYLTERFRLELEASYGRASNARIKFASGFTGNPLAGTTQSGGGSAQSRGVMFNMLYDFPVPGSRLTPFLGLGAGLINVKVSSLGPHPSPFRMNDTAFGATGCLLAGFNYAVSKHTDFTLRYTGVIRSKMTFRDFVGGQQVRAVTPSGFSQGLSVGLRFRLN